MVHVNWTAKRYDGLWPCARKLFVRLRIGSLQQPKHIHLNKAHLHTPPSAFCSSHPLRLDLPRAAPNRGSATRLPPTKLKKLKSWMVPLKKIKLDATSCVSCRTNLECTSEMLVYSPRQKAICRSYHVDDWWCTTTLPFVLMVQVPAAIRARLAEW